MSGPPLGIVGEALATLRAYVPKPASGALVLDANESPWPLPEEARRRLSEVLAEVPLHRYPDGAASELKAALAAKLGASVEELLVGVGSDEVISILMAAFDRARGEGRPTVLYPTPTFVMYAISARIHGFEPVGVPLDASFRLDVPAMERALGERAPNLVFLASPNNPTGTRFADDAIEAVVRASPGSLVVIDEAYAHFADRGVSELVKRHPNVAVMGTLSKVGLAGLRVGWVRMNEALIAEAEKARPPYNLNSLSQRAATLFLTELAEVLDVHVARIVTARAELFEELAAIEGVRVVPSQANFILIDVGDAGAAHRGLLERGIQVRRFADDRRLAGMLRVTVGTSEENHRFIGALSATLAG